MGVDLRGADTAYVQSRWLFLRLSKPKGADVSTAVSTLISWFLIPFSDWRKEDPLEKKLILEGEHGSHLKALHGPKQNTWSDKMNKVTLSHSQKCPQDV